MGKFYILIGEYGSWDNHYHWNAGYYTEHSLAEDAKKELLKEIELLNYPCPLPNIENISEDELTSIDISDNYDWNSLSDEIKSKYHKWYCDNSDYREFVGLEISEIKINNKPKTFRS